MEALRVVHNVPTTTTVKELRVDEEFYDLLQMLLFEEFPRYNEAELGSPQELRIISTRGMQTTLTVVKL